MFCMKCGAENADGSKYCRACGVQLNSNIEDDPAMRLLLPVGRSGLAIAAGYMGLFSILGVPGPVAILLGVLALNDIKRNPKKIGKGRAIFGIVMGVIGTALTVAILVPSWIAKW